MRRLERERRLQIRLQTTGKRPRPCSERASDLHLGSGGGALTLYDKQDDRAEQVPAAAMFVLIGGEPRTQWLPESVRLEGGADAGPAAERSDAAFILIYLGLFGSTLR